MNSIYNFSQNSVYCDYMQEVQTQTTQVSKESSTTPVNNDLQRDYSQKKTIFRVYQIIWYILGVMETLLIARFLLRALAANPGTGFVNLIYSLSEPLAAPFRGIFPTPQVEGAVFEWHTLVACIVYAIVAWGLVQLFQLVKPTDRAEVEHEVQ